MVNRLLATRIGFLAFALLVALPSAVVAQSPAAAALADAGPPAPVAPAVVARDAEGRVTMRAVRIREPIKLDGNLDEPVYSTVPAVGDFIQQEPHEGEPSTERTEVWLLFDDRALYFATRFWYTDPTRIVANEMRRDNRNVSQNDAFSIVLDTFHDRRTGFMFQTNALGALREGLVTDDGLGINFDWSTVWDVRTRRFDQGWTAEIVIPFKSLRYRDGSPQVWGVNFRRSIRAKNETVHLTKIPASVGIRSVQRVSFAATLVGIEIPQNSRNLEVKPYAVSSVTTNRAVTPRISNDLGGDVGVDAKYGLTKGLTFDFTYNTDFAQVEDDETQVNLTRFSLFFPEKREFFLEGQGVFEFGGIRTAGNAATAAGGGGGDPGRAGAPVEAPVLFFSRRIGLQSDTTIPIRAGGRITGRAGQYTLGLINIETGDTPEANAPATNFSVVRVKRDILRRSSVGILATNRSEGQSGGPANQVFGVDSSLALFQDLQINSYYAVTRTPGVDGDDRSYRSELNYSGDRYGVVYELLKVGPDFNPEIGFLRRQDFRRNFGQLRFSPRVAAGRKSPVRKYSYEASLDYFETSAGRLESRLAQGTFRAEMNNGDMFTLEYNRNYELLEEPFQIASGVVLPVGAYGFNDAKLSYRLGPQRRISGELTTTRGGFYDGDRTEVGYNGRMEITTKLSVEPRVSVNRVELPVGRFTARLVSTRATYTLSPRMFVGALIQYNSSNSALTTNARFRWEYSPGSDLFVVFSEGRDSRFDGFPTLQNRGVVVKYTRLFRF